MVIIQADTPEEFRIQLIKRLNWFVQRDTRALSDTKRSPSDRLIYEGRIQVLNEILADLYNAPILSKGKLHAPSTPAEAVTHILEKQRGASAETLDGAIRDMSLQLGIPVADFDRNSVADFLCRLVKEKTVKIPDAADLLTADGRARYQQAFIEQAEG